MIALWLIVDERTAPAKGTVGGCPLHVTQSGRAISCRSWSYLLEPSQAGNENARGAWGSSAVDPGQPNK